MLVATVLRFDNKQQKEDSFHLPFSQNKFK